MTGIFLRPLASPMALGFLALGGATVTLSGLQLGWYPVTETTAVALVLVLFGFPLQFLSAIFGFLARDAAAATGMGVLASSWLTTGLVKLVTPAGSTSTALGVLLLFAGTALLVPATGAALGKLVPALVLFAASARFMITGVYQLTGSASVEFAAGVAGLVLLGLALYAALALEIEGVRHRTVLPVLRWGRGRMAVQGTREQQLADIENEAGVRDQL